MNGISPGEGAFSQRVTIRQVATKAGVSRQTVSNVLNAPNRVAADTLEHVRGVITKLGYQRDEAARSLTSGRSRLFGVRIGQSVQQHSTTPEPLLVALANTAARYDHRLLLFGSAAGDADQIAEYSAIWNGRAVDGFLISDTHPGDLRPGWLTKHRIPFVSFGRPWGAQTVEHSWIDVDGNLGMRLAVEHVISRGAKRIAYLGWEPDGAGGDDRAAGWQSAVRDHGLSAMPRLQARAEDHRGVRDSVWDAVSAHRADAFVCASDLLAALAVRAVENMGRSVGTDVLVTGFDDSTIAALARPAITSLSQPYDEISDFLVAQLLTSPQEPPRTKIVAPELIVRGSA